MSIEPLDTTESSGDTSILLNLSSETPPGLKEFARDEPGAVLAHMKQKGPCPVLTKEALQLSEQRVLELLEKVEPREQDAYEIIARLREIIDQAPGYPVARFNLPVALVTDRQPEAAQAEFLASDRVFDARLDDASLYQEEAVKPVSRDVVLLYKAMNLRNWGNAFTDGRLPRVDLPEAMRLLHLSIACLEKIAWPEGEGAEQWPDLSVLLAGRWTMLAALAAETGDMTKAEDYWQRAGVHTAQRDREAEQLAATFPKFAQRFGERFQTA